MLILISLSLYVRCSTHTCICFGLHRFTTPTSTNLPPPLLDLNVYSHSFLSHDPLSSLFVCLLHFLIHPSPSPSTSSFLPFLLANPRKLPLLLPSHLLSFFVCVLPFLVVANPCTLFFASLLCSFFECLCASFSLCIIGNMCIFYLSLLSHAFYFLLLPFTLY